MKAIKTAFALISLFIVICAAVGVSSLVQPSFSAEVNVQASPDVKIPVLLYHDFVETSDAADPNNLEYICTKTQFEENIDFLLRQGYTSITFLDLYNAKNRNIPLPEKPFLVTFDDGYIGQYTIAYPIIERYKLKVSMFVVTDWVGRTTEDGTFFTWNHARKMKQSGNVDIFSHSTRHAYYARVPLNSFVSDVRQSCRIVERQVGNSAVRVFAYPYGNWNDKMVNALKTKQIDIQVYDLGIDTLSTLDLSYVRRINIPMHMTGQEIQRIIEST